MRVETASADKSDSDAKRVQRWRAALKHLRQALRILDESDAPDLIGAQLDLAIHRLKEAIDRPEPENRS